MMNALRHRAKLVHQVLSKPEKFRYLLTTRKGLYALRYLISPPKHGTFDAVGDGISVRQYKGYDEYLDHQRSKLSLVDLRDYDKRFRADLAKRLRKSNWAGKSVLCLAARIGTEVRAFHDVGAFAVGIDLQPGSENHWVLPGDFHHLVFADDSVDGVYCNSLDHALELGKLLAEVRRVLKPDGVFHVDAQHQSNDGDDWGATGWNAVDDVIQVIEKAGFRLKNRTPITIPQPGEQLRFIAGE
jgi:SAM-dependent methyltransferase